MSARGRGRRRILHIGLAAAALLVIDAQPAMAAPLGNGDFETGDLPPWRTVSNALEFSAAQWSVESGDEAPLSGSEIQPPPEGDFQAVADQTGPGFNILHQAFDVGDDDERLTMRLWYRNHAEVFFTPRTFNFTNQRNQQLRIDLMRPTAPVRSFDPDDILATVFRTRKGDGPELDPSELRFNVRPYQGERVRLRIAQVATEFFFNVGVDAVSVGPFDGGRIGLTPLGEVASGGTRAGDATGGSWRN